MYYYNLYRRLSLDCAHPVVVLTTKVPHWEEFDSLVSNNGLEVIRRSTPLPNFNWTQLLRLIQHLANTVFLCRLRSIALLHSGDLFPQGIVCLCIKRCLGIPYVAYSHGEDITMTDRRRLQPKLRNLIYRHADAVIAANGFARAHLLRIGVAADKTHMILPGVDSERFASTFPSQELIDQLGLKGKTVMLSVGRLVPHKGHAVLLDAFANLAPLVPQLHYLIAGVGPELERLKAQAERLGIARNVSFLGSVSEAVLPQIYALCDFFALANREIDGEMEGFGMVFIEANAAGKPVMGGRTGGVAGAILHNVTGLLFDPEDPNETAQTLLEMATDDKLRFRLGSQGRERTLRDFNWSRSAAHLAQVCDRVLDGYASGAH